MEDPDHSQPESPSHFPSTSTVDEPSSSSSGNLNPEDQPEAENGQPEQENEDSSGHRENEEAENQQQQRRYSILSYRVNLSVSGAASSGMTDDVWSCLVVLLTFWAFASMILILGVFGSITLTLGPSCSRLVQTNSFFVQSIQVEAMDESKAGPMLYGFHEPPPLDTVINWTETHKAIVPVDFHKEWLPKAQYNTYQHVAAVSSENSSKSTFMDVHWIEGIGMESCFVAMLLWCTNLSNPYASNSRESLVDWIEDPSHPNTTLSRNIIYGSGRIQQEILRSSDYYIAMGNFNNEEVEVELNFEVKAFIYNTTKAYNRCSISKHSCSLRLFLFGATTGVLTSPGPKEDALDDHWHVKLSYGPRWISYITGSGMMTVIFLLAFRFCSVFQASRERRQAGELESERAPLLPRKDDDDSSWGSYDSISHDEEDVGEWLAENSLERKPVAEGEDHRRLCVICFDAARDCFFLPCGHCAACFTCATRIAEEASTCPMCRRSIKKVRKIFTA